MIIFYVFLVLCGVVNVGFAYCVLQAVRSKPLWVDAHRARLLNQGLLDDNLPHDGPPVSLVWRSLAFVGGYCSPGAHLPSHLIVVMRACIMMSSMCLILGSYMQATMEPTAPGNSGIVLIICLVVLLTLSLIPAWIGFGSLKPALHTHIVSPSKVKDVLYFKNAEKFAGWFVVLFSLSLAVTSTVMLSLRYLQQNASELFVVFAGLLSVPAIAVSAASFVCCNALYVFFAMHVRLHAKILTNDLFTLVIGHPEVPAAAHQEVVYASKISNILKLFVRMQRSLPPLCNSLSVLLLTSVSSVALSFSFSIMYAFERDTEGVSAGVAACCMLSIGFMWSLLHGSKATEQLQKFVFLCSTVQLGSIEGHHRKLFISESDTTWHQSASLFLGFSEELNRSSSSLQLQTEEPASTPCALSQACLSAEDELLLKKFCANTQQCLVSFTLFGTDLSVRVVLRIAGAAGAAALFLFQIQFLRTA
eukprot:ANDGO_06603.mRNA.1 hypothetical protein